MKQLYNAIKEIATKNPDGFTVDLTTLKKVTGGISVAYIETQNSFDDEALKRVIQHAMEHEKKVGGWFDFDDQLFYYDSVRIFTDLEEAKRFAGENDQIAIFDIARDRLVKL